MNREIKFRVWCKGTSTNANFNKPRWILPTDFILLKYYRCFQDVIESDDFVVHQYTGLQDRDGKDIYEGDIIQALPATRYGMGIDQSQYDYMLLQTPKIVLYNNGSYKLFDKIPHSYSEIVVNYYIDADMKIIGNIMQNPELIKTNE